MKEKPNIEELLNSFIDGELTQREQVEVQRLVAHDAKVAEQLRKLQKCKMLVGSLPFAEPPVGMLEDIKSSLEKRVLLSQRPGGFDEREGARHLLARKVLTAAAMVGLAAVLAAVIYTIVAPEGVTEKPLAVESWEQPIGRVEADKPEPSVVATVEKSVGKAGVAAVWFDGRVELKTSYPSVIAAFIDKSIEDNGLLDCVAPKSQKDKSVYALNCSREEVNLLLADLRNVWVKFDSATLFVETGRVGEQITVDEVSAEQIVEIISQDSGEECIRVAKDFAVLNDMAELLSGTETLAAIDDRKPDLTIPKPALTSSEKMIKKPTSRGEDERIVRLTIVIVGNE